MEGGKNAGAAIGDGIDEAWLAAIFVDVEVNIAGLCEMMSNNFLGE